MVIKKVKIPIYLGTLTLIKCKGGLEKLPFKYSLVDHKEKGFDAMVYSYTYPNGYIEYVILFTGEITNKIIAHECIHFINKLFTDRGIELDRFNDEPQAYLMGWAFEQCEKFINKNK